MLIMIYIYIYLCFKAVPYENRQAHTESESEILNWVGVIMLDDIKHFTSFFVPRQILKECYSPENLPISKN